MNKKLVRTDADVMRIANRIDSLQDEIADLIELIGNGEHPNAEAIRDDLYNQCYFVSWANHVVHGYLAKPEQWDCLIFEGGYGRYFHKAGRQAAKSRFYNRIKHNTPQEWEALAKAIEAHSAPEG